MSEQQLSLFEKLKSLRKKKNETADEKTKTVKRNQGDKAENLAYDFLLKQGLSLIDKNFTTRAGEVDLIMQDKNDADTLIFIEVRYRKNKDFGGAAASVTPKKQRRIIKAALAYQQQNAPQSSMRFDVIAIEGDNNDKGFNKNSSNKMEINWIKSAFDGF